MRAHHVILDHAWLWRADHDSVGHLTARENPGRITRWRSTEITLADLTQWRGEDGKVFF